MNSVKTIDVLNRLVRLHHRSLASYLGYAPPNWRSTDNGAQSTLSLMSDQQQEIVDRAGDLVVEQGGVVDYGAYPMTYTGYHDLSFEYLLGKLLTEQDRAVSEIEECVVRSSETPRVHELAQEALGMAKGHRASLEELKSTSADA